MTGIRHDRNRANFFSETQNFFYITRICKDYYYYYHYIEGSSATNAIIFYTQVYLHTYTYNIHTRSQDTTTASCVLTQQNVSNPSQHRSNSAANLIKMMKFMESVCLSCARKIPQESNRPHYTHIYICEYIIRIYNAIWRATGVLSIDSYINSLSKPRTIHV